MTDWICSTGSSPAQSPMKKPPDSYSCALGTQKEHKDSKWTEDFIVPSPFPAGGKAQQGSPLRKLWGVWYSMATLWVLIHSIKRFIALAGCKCYTRWTAPHSVFCAYPPSVPLSTLGYFMDLEPCSSCLPLTGLFQLWGNPAQSSGFGILGIRLWNNIGGANFWTHISI